MVSIDQDYLCLLELQIQVERPVLPTVLPSDELDPRGPQHATIHARYGECKVESSVTPK